MSKKELKRFQIIKDRLSESLSQSWSKDELLAVNRDEEIPAKDIEFILNARQDIEYMLKLLFDGEENSSPLQNLQRVREIQKRFLASTRGFWSAWVEGRDQWGGDTILDIEPCSLPKNGQTHWNVYLPSYESSDYDFIVSSREDIPWLYRQLL